MEKTHTVYTDAQVEQPKYKTIHDDPDWAYDIWRDQELTDGVLF